MYIFISYLFTYYHVTPSFPSSLCFCASTALSFLKERAHFASTSTAISIPTLQVSSTLPFHCHVISHSSTLLRSLLSTAISFPTVQVSSALASPLPCHFLQPQVLLLRHLYCHVIASGASLFYWARENALLLIALEVSFVWVA